MKILIEQLKESGLEYVEQENISQNVIQAIEAEDKSKNEMIQKLVPPRWQKLFCQFAGTVGSPFHESACGGNRQYFGLFFARPL